MRLQEAGGNWKVETTTEKLAETRPFDQKARGGNIAYKWGHNNKFVRVVWEKGRSRRRGSSGYHRNMMMISRLGNPNSVQKMSACTPARQCTSFAIHWRVARLTFSILLSAGSLSSV